LIFSEPTFHSKLAKENGFDLINSFKPRFRRQIVSVEKLGLTKGGDLNQRNGTANNTNKKHHFKSLNPPRPEAKSCFLKFYRFFVISTIFFVFAILF